jgi:hypothetical protein
MCPATRHIAAGALPTTGALPNIGERPELATGAPSARLVAAVIVTLAKRRDASREQVSAAAAGT